MLSAAIAKKSEVSTQRTKIYLLRSFKKKLPPRLNTLISLFTVLSNDHKELTTQMEIIIHRLHAMSKDTGTVSLPAAAAGGTVDYGGVSHVDARPIADPLAVPSRSTHAFAEVDEVAEKSPAAAAGLQIGDLMIRFAHVTSQTPNFLSAVAGALAAGEGKELEAVVLRNGEEVKLRLIPQKWEGRGLLGCHLQPLR